MLRVLLFARVHTLAMRGSIRADARTIGAPVRSTGAPARSLLPFAAALVICSCSRVDRVDEDSGGAALMRNLLRAGRVEVVVPHGPAEETCKRLAARYSGRDGLSYRVVDPEHEEDNGDPHAARIVVGRRDMPLSFDLCSRLSIGVNIEGQRPSFRFQEQVFDRPGDGFVATFEDPDRPGLPLTIFYSNDERLLIGYLGDLEPAWRPNLCVYRAGDLELEGPLRISGAPIPERIVRSTAARVSLRKSLVDLCANTHGLSGKMSRDIPAERAREYMLRVSTACAVTATWASPGDPALPMPLCLYARPEDLARAAPAHDLSSLNPSTGAVHALCAADLPDDGGSAAARATAIAKLGAPVEPWLLDGAAVSAAGSWWGRDLDLWIAWLRASGIAPSAAELAEARAGERLSPHLLQPLRAALFRFALETRGDSHVRQFWRGTERFEVDESVESAFASWLDAHCAPQRAAIDAERARRAARSTPSLWKGIGFEEPPAPRAQGFLSPGFAGELAEVASIGANAIEIDCFSIGEPDPARVAGPARRRGIGPLEGDLSVFTGLSRARSQGLVTLLQPHLQSAPGGTWSGSWLRNGRPAWSEFFDDYRRFLVHYALLAELSGCDVLSLGSNISEVTRATAEGRRGRPEEIEWKREGWSRVIAAARGAFSGKLTYAAGSIEEAGKIAFWTELDAIGIEWCPQMRIAPGSSEPAGRWQFAAKLNAQWIALDELAKKHARPILVTRAGFTPGVNAPQLARFGPGSSDGDLASFQFEMLRSVLESASKARLQGVFTWRWSTDPGDAGANERDYLFRQKPAEAAVRRMFAQL